MKNSRLGKNYGRISWEFISEGSKSFKDLLSIFTVASSALSGTSPKSDDVNFESTFRL